MANRIDQDQQWLLNCLSASLDPKHEVRTFAEASLSQAELQPGFGAALAKVAANRELPFGLRQLASVLLKQFVKKHWKEEDEDFVHPLVSNAEKETIRGHLLLSLDDPHRKICTAISMAVGSIASYDWPEEWPDLLPFLLKLVSDQSNENGVHGALRCLAILSADMDDSMVPKLIPALFPSLHRIVSSPQLYETSVRAKALSIVYSCASMLGVMSGVYETETRSLMSSMIKPWMEQFALILQHQVQSENPDDLSIKVEVLKCLNQFAQNFPSLTEAEFTVVAGPLWQTFISSLNLYEKSAIDGNEDPLEGRYDSDGSEKSLESFVIQIFELLLTIAGSSKLVKVIENNLRELAYYTIAFLQITQQQIHAWSTDANQYVADEDENVYNCRASVSLLLEEIVGMCGAEGATAVIDAAKRRFSESQQEMGSGYTMWWRIREAILFALGSMSEPLLEAQESGLTSGIGPLIEELGAEDYGVNEYPFLSARVFATLAKYFSVISPGVLQSCLYSAVRALATEVPPPVKVGACRAISQILPESDRAVIQPHLMSIFSSLVDLLNQASDETLHLVLETMQAAVKAGTEMAPSIEPIISPIILNLWAAHVSDPFISIDAIEVLEALKSAPGCIHPLVTRVLPYVGPILVKPHQQPEGLVGGSLDLVTMLLKSAPSNVIKAIYDICFDPVIRIVLVTDDHGEMQNATECLAAMVAGAQQDILSWGTDSGFTMRSLLDVASRLLDPDLESSGSLFVGSYILQLIVHLSSQMAPHIQGLVAAIVRRMQTCQIAGLRSSLILILARLVHMSVPDVNQFINLLLTVPAEGYDNAFAYVMTEWAKQQVEIQGAYQIKVTTTALALLLSTRHMELSKINVQGQLIKSNAGVVTRSKAKLAPDQWTVIPLPAKILALLADLLIEIQEQVAAGDDQEDSDWEEVNGGPTESELNSLRSAATASGGRTSYDQLEALAKLCNEEEDDSEFDPISSSDPLNEINMAGYLMDFIIKFAHADRPLFDHLSQHLTQPQRKAIQMVLNR
uniref:Importin N-terminal domain-containing protein n=1 Tax=Kalanchoe fedtschenkoi TaxID=63787 RepID=A0A7N0ULB8_KALFE